MNKTTGRWIIVFVTMALLALVYSHLLGRSVGEVTYGMMCPGNPMCEAWRSAAIAQGVAVVMLAAAAWVYNERRV